MTPARPRPMHGTHHPSRPTLHLVPAPIPVPETEPRTRAGHIIHLLADLHARVPFVLRAWTWGNAVALVAASAASALGGF